MFVEGDVEVACECEGDPVHGHELMPKLLVVAIGLALFCVLPSGFTSRLADMIREFKGGPRPPSQPLPADDSRLLKRREIRRS